MDANTLLSPTALTVAGAVTGSVATATGTRSVWYRRLRKPSIQPPGAVFPVVWTGLYASVIGASAVAVGSLPDSERSAYQRALAINMALNSGWCWTFFRFHRLTASVVVAGALAVSTADLARRAGRASGPAGVALLPYAAWTAFATALSEAIRRANPRA